MYTVVYDTVYDRLRPYTEFVTVDLGNSKIRKIIINKKFKNLIIYIACDLKEKMTTLMLVSVGVPDDSFVGLRNI